MCLACARDRIAVAFPKSGVKVWIWCKGKRLIILRRLILSGLFFTGSWLAQRSIMRTNVTALKFIDGGDALLGGTREGVVYVGRRVGCTALIIQVVCRWHCAVPNGTMKVYAFLQSSMSACLFSLVSFIS